jgi:hypothetical protein
MGRMGELRDRDVFLLSCIIHFSLFCIVANESVVFWYNDAASCTNLFVH